MYICICKAVTEHQICEVIRSGACTRKEIRAHLGAGTGCGKCNPEIHALLCRGRPENHNPLRRRAGEATVYPRNGGQILEACS